MADIKISGKLVNDTDNQLADAEQIMVQVRGSKKNLQSAIDNGDIGGGGDAEADNYIGNTDSDKVIRVDTECQSVAEGAGTAEGNYSHAEGVGTKANGDYSHAEGSYANAEGMCSHAEGMFALVQNTAEHGEGIYNASHTHDSNPALQTVHSVGIGSGIYSRRNAHEIMRNGDHYFGDGKLYLGRFGQAKGRLDVAEETLSVSLNGFVFRRYVEGLSDSFEYDSRDIDGVASSSTYAYRFGIMGIGGATEVVPKYENSFIGREVTVNGITYIVPIEGSRKDVSCDLSPYIKGSDDQFYYVIPGTVISSATVSLGILSSIPVLLNNLLPKVNVAYKDRWVTYTYYTGDDNLRIDVPSDYNCIYDLRQKTGGTITINMSNAGRNYKETVIYLNDAYGYSIEGDDYIEVNEPPSDENSGVIISIQNNIIVYGEIPAQE